MSAKPDLRLVNALRETARRLESGDDYNWCHMGRCNCGHLAQTITKLHPAEIHEMALLKAGDWTDQSQSVEHCTATGYTIDHILETMMDLGMTRGDIAHLERLSDMRVLVRIDLERRKKMHHRNREDVVLYMRSWASLIEEQLVETVPDHVLDHELWIERKHIDQQERLTHPGKVPDFA